MPRRVSEPPGHFAGFESVQPLISFRRLDQRFERGLRGFKLRRPEFRRELHRGDEIPDKTAGFFAEKLILLIREIREEIGEHGLEPSLFRNPDSG